MTIKKQNKFYVKMFACVPPPYGGVCVYVKRLSLALTKRGLLSGAYFHDTLTGIPSEYSHMYHPMLNHARSVFVLPELFKLIRTCKDYEIVHSHLSFPTYMSMWLVRLILRKRVVLTIHNQMIDRELETLNYLDKCCLKALFNDKNVQVITVNDKGKALLLDKGYRFRNEIKVLPAYIAPVEIGMPKDYLSPQLLQFINTYPRYIVFYAESFAYYNEQEIYGTEECIKAYSELSKEQSDLALVFCMPNMNDEVKLSKIKEIAKRSGCSKRIYWQLEGISEMWPLLKKSILYLRTTSTDGDSVLLREALGLGVPSLASNVVNRPSECRTYQYGNQDDLLIQMRTMLEHPNSPKCTCKDYFGEMFNIYNELLNN